MFGYIIYTFIIHLFMMKLVVRRNNKTLICTDYAQRNYLGYIDYKMGSKDPSYIQYTYWMFCDKAGNCRYANFKLDIKSNNCAPTLVATTTGILEDYNNAKEKANCK